MHQVSLARALAALFALALAACGEPELPRVERPARHVLLIVIDTLRADRVGAFGCPRDTSPGIDGLARRGVRFENALAQSSWTSPSMVSLLSGRYLAERRLSVPKEVPTLAELFRAEGFGTAAFVTNPLLSEQNGFDRGFDRFVASPHFLSDPRIADWIRSQAGRPTFTYVHLCEPHDPYRPPQRFLDVDRIELSADVARLFAEETARRGLADLDGARARVEAELARYEGEVRCADATVQQVLRALADAGELDDAAIAITADHGEGLWTRTESDPWIGEDRERGAPLTAETVFKKRHGCQLHQELIRVPLVLAAPDLPRGAVVEELVENVDLAPTLLELAGFAPPDEFQGRSLLGLLRDPPTWTKRTAFSATQFVRTVVTAEGLKLHVPTEFGVTEGGLELELYDLARDPNERRNLAAERADLVRELAPLLEAWARTGLPAEKDDAEAELERNLPALRALGYVDGEETGVELDPSPELPR